MCEIKRERYWVVRVKMKDYKKKDRKINLSKIRKTGAVGYLSDSLGVMAWICYNTLEERFHAMPVLRELWGLASMETQPAIVEGKALEKLEDLLH